MVCSVCGSEIPDGADSCPECGEVQNKISDEKKPKKSLSLVIIAAVIVLVCAAFAVKLGSFGGSSENSAEITVNTPPVFTSSDDLNEQIVEYIKNNDADGLVSITSGFTAYSLGENKDAGESFKEQLDIIKSKFDTALGSDYTVSFEADDEVTVTGEELLNSTEQLKTNYPDYNWDGVSAMNTVSGVLTAEKEGAKASVNLVIMNFKEEDSWKLCILLCY